MEDAQSHDRGAARREVPGAWLLLAPWILGYGAMVAVHSVVAGAFVMVFAAIRGTVGQRFGAGWARLVRG